MPEFQRFANGNGQTVYLSVENASGDGVMDRALEVLGALAWGVSQEVANMPENTRPEDVDVSFGLVPGPDGGFAVSPLTQGHFQVTMRWTSDFAEDFGEIQP